MMIWWVIFCEVIPNVLFYWFPVYKEILFHPLLCPIKYHIHCLRLFRLVVVVKLPSESELYNLIGIGGWLKPSSLRVMRRGKAVFPLCKSLPTSALEVKATKCLSILHSVWIGTFAGGRGCGYFVGSAG